mmetsp:Transcript_33881/g.107610  ORF Transcript_33881/g.107610 Transcript_33881/m.107610 type:complete len:326 (-) Transcript_33881:602-1579(-)
MRGAASVRRSKAPGVFVSTIVTMRTAKSSISSAPPSPARTAEKSPPRSSIRKSRRKSSASAWMESSAGAAPRSLLARSAARLESVAGPRSPSAAPPSAGISASGLINGKTRSSTPSCNTAGMAVGRTTRRFTRAPSNCAEEPARGRKPLDPPWQRPRSIEAGPSCLHSSRSAVTMASRHSSCTVQAKASPRRKTLQRAPAARLQSRQFAGCRCLRNEATSSPCSGASCSLKAGTLCPARHRFPSVLAASSVGVNTERPLSISSMAASMPFSSPSKCREACSMHSWSWGGRPLLPASSRSTSMSNRRCGSGYRPANSAIAFALMDR